MSDTAKTLTEIEKAKAILLTFAQNGFHKTSMENIGNAIGISRQSIYKKFGSKEKCYEWVLHAYIADIYTRTFAALEGDSTPPLKTLVQTMDILAGKSVEIISHSHGATVLDDALAATHSSQEDWPIRLRARMANFLERNNLVSADKANGVAFTLTSAAKGLLLETPNRDQFLKDISTIIKSITNTEK